MSGLSTKRSVALVLVLLVAAPALIGVAEPRLRAQQRVYAQAANPPPPILHHFTFGHRLGLSAALWLQLLNWYGGEFARTGGPKRHLLRPEQVTFVDAQTELILELDPHFRDPYRFVAMFLMWEARKPERAIDYLAQAMEHHPNHWIYPFYIGFTHFYFLDDDETGGQYILRAAALPGAPAFVPLLGTMLSRRAGATEDAILVLEGILAEGLPEGLETAIEYELADLRAVLNLERAVTAFRTRHQRIPSMDDLLAHGYVPGVPVDADGEPLLLDADGTVRLASDR
jgi:hypothetical protein